MPNLCICTDDSLEDFTGGTDRIISLAKNVSRHGFNVYLIDRSARTSFSSFFLDTDKYYKIESGLLKQRNYPRSMRFLFPGLIRLYQYILNRLVSVFTFSSFPAVGLSYLTDPYLIAKLLFVCKKQRIDVVQCECTVTAPSAYVIKKLLNIPLVYDAHNVETEMTRSLANASKAYIALLKLVEKTSCNMCDSVFAVSEIDKKTFLSWGIPKNKIEIIPNSFDFNKFSASLDGNRIRKKYNLAEKVVMIFHGTFSYPPNYEAATILAKSILPRIVEKCPKICLILVGRDPPKMDDPRIIPTGFVDNLEEHIAAADIGVVPLLRGGGTRIKIVEYMASGKAVVSTFKAAEGLNLQNGIDILMTESPDSKFVDLVIEMITNKSLRREIGINAKKKAELFYNWEKNAERAVEIYNKLVYSSNVKRYGKSTTVAG